MMMMALILILAFVFAGSGVKMHLDVAGE